MAAIRGSSRTPSFWNQPRPIRTSHAETRPRTRSRSMSFVDTQMKSGVTFEVENFRIYGDLRKTETEVRNTLPTAMTIQTEKTLLCFEKERKKAPADADYSLFYRCLSASVTPNPSSTPSNNQKPQQESSASAGGTAAANASNTNTNTNTIITNATQGDVPHATPASRQRNLRVVRPSYLQ